jgi:hypothetical protein
MRTIQSLLNEIDRQKNILYRVKAFFSHMNDDVIGRNVVRAEDIIGVEGWMYF